MKDIKVRFNLGLGKNYRKWKIEGPLGVEYHDPSKVQLEMKGCILKNNKKTARKIYDGQHKTVCAWVMCDNISINYLDYPGYKKKYGLDQLKYNPRHLPHWTKNDCNFDDMAIPSIISQEEKLFTI